MPRGKGNVIATPEKLDDARTTAAAVNLRMYNLTYEEIGETLGIAEDKAKRIVNGALREYNAEALSNVEVLRAIMAKRYEEFMDAWRDKAIVEHDYRAADLYLKSLKDTRDFLGLDTVSKVDPSEFNEDRSLVVTIKKPPKNDADDPPQIIEVVSDDHDDGSSDAAA